MSAPLVSVIVPVYNGERFLREALESLFLQDFDSFETIVVDDGSEDNSAAIAETFPVTSILRQPNRGAAAARNAAIAVSEGSLIAFLDADDLLPRTKLKVQAEHLQTHPDVGCAFGRQEWINPPPWLTRDAVYGELDGIPILSAMIRRSVFDTVGLFDESFAVSSDMDLVIRMREHGVSVEVLDELVLYRRFHGNNLSLQREGNPLVRSLRAKLERERAGER